MLFFLFNWKKNLFFFVCELLKKSSSSLYCILDKKIENEKFLNTQNNSNYNNMYINNDNKKSLKKPLRAKIKSRSNSKEKINNRSLKKYKINNNKLWRNKFPNNKIKIEGNNDKMNSKNEI